MLITTSPPQNLSRGVRVKKKMTKKLRMMKKRMKTKKLKVQPLNPSLIT